MAEFQRRAEAEHRRLTEKLTEVARGKDSPSDVDMNRDTRRSGNSRNSSGSERERLLVIDQKVAEKVLQERAAM